MEIRINKDVGSYEPKTIGPFTIRQACSLCIGAPICIWIYKYAAPFLPKDVVTFLLVIPAAITALFGWFKPYGMPMEKFLKSIFVNIILAPGNRIYKTEQEKEKPSSYCAQTELQKEQRAQKASSHKGKKSQKYKRYPDGIE